MSRLCLKSTIYNFILFLSLLEIISNILLDYKLSPVYTYLHRVNSTIYSRIKFTLLQIPANSTMVKHFFYAQIFTLTTFFTLLFPAIIESVLVPISILAYNPCFLNYVSFGIIPDISIVKHIQDVFIYLVFVLQAIQMVCLFIVELFFIGLYFLLTVAIVMSCENGFDNDA